MSTLQSLASLVRSNTALEAVEGNDDLLAIVLAQLSARTIFRFRCVSKRWNSIIYTPCFSQTFYNNRKAQSRLLAYIQQTNRRINVLPVPPSNDIFSSHEFNQGLVNISNGLLLCRSFQPTEYRIINPLTNKRLLLPANKVIKFPLMTLTCEENARDLTLSYEVIAIGPRKENYLEMETYSSKTCEWIASKLSVTKSFLGLMTGDTLVVNGIIHWLAYGQQVAVYDSNQDKTEPSLETIKLPCRLIDGDLRFARASGKDPLWLCAHIYNCVRIWMLPNTGNETEWVLMHNISCQRLYESVKSKGGVCYSTWYVYSKLYTTLAGLVPWKSPLVALIGMADFTSIYIVNLESMAFEQLQFPVLEDPDTYIFHPYMEPLCLSSYTF